MRKETFLLIGEEVDFLDFLFLFVVEALLMSSSRSLLISRCILLDLDLTIFAVFNLRSIDRLVKFWDFISIYTDSRHFFINYFGKYFFNILFQRIIHNFFYLNF